MALPSVIKSVIGAAVVSYELLASQTRVWLNSLSTANFGHQLVAKGETVRRKDAAYTRNLFQLVSPKLDTDGIKHTCTVSVIVDYAEAHFTRTEVAEVIATNFTALLRGDQPSPAGTLRTEILASTSVDSFIRGSY